MAQDLNSGRPASKALTPWFHVASTPLPVSPETPLRAAHAVWGAWGDQPSVDHL